MPIPLPVLLAAAERIARDERAQALARGAVDTIWRKGNEFWRNRTEKTAAATELAVPALAAPVEPATPPAATPAGKTGLRGAVSKRRRFRAGQTGDLVRFDHTDGHGLKTTRTVGNWTSDGEAISGYCLNLKRDCSFALKGVDNWREMQIDE